MSRFGIFDTEASDSEFTAKLYEEIVHFPWFQPEVRVSKTLHTMQNILPGSTTGGRSRFLPSDYLKLILCSKNMPTAHP